MLKRRNEPDKDPSNQPLFVDEWAETQIEEFLQTKFHSRITLIGEESFQIYPNLKDLGVHEKVVALVDIIDGTDLLLRGLSNWCSAVVFFYPPDRRILAAAVGDHLGNVFFASDEHACAYSYARDAKRPVPLSDATRPMSPDQAMVNVVRLRPSGPVRAISLQDACVAFYGQKPPSFLSVQTPRFIERMNELAAMLKRKERPAPALRIHALGGIPMMLKVANGTMDAVFDITGPKPHDMVAGAYIAMKAGAYLGNASNRSPITESNLAQYLLKPNDPGPKYILAATESLYAELQELLVNGC